MNRLVDSLVFLVTECGEDMELQARWGEVVGRALVTYKKVLHLTLPWRPLFERLLDSYVRPQPQLQSTYLRHLQQNTLLTTAAKLRRYFPPEAAAEIYEVRNETTFDLTSE